MKRKCAIITLVTIALVLPLVVLAQGTTAAENEVRAVIDELQKANLKGGPEAVPIFEKYYAEEFLRIPSNGVVYTKAQNGKR